MALLTILSFSQLGLLFGIFVVAYLAYTVYLHPLASYPGPKKWAISRLPWCWNQYYGNLSQRLLELHDQYGPVVRISPNELSYTTNTAWKTIYGPRSNEMQRDPNFKLITPNGVESKAYDACAISIDLQLIKIDIMTSGRESHARQRRVLSYAFSEKALREQEPIMQAYCTKLCSILTDLQGKGAVDMEKWYTFASKFLSSRRDRLC
ncbi:hypothetical protein Golomagni_08373 [Golovinomyces magnicellulatus]|nr:hypothetical protein Golomagni_08373 [Golovinomyces magnicellulatus]